MWPKHKFEIKSRLGAGFWEPGLSEYRCNLYAIDTVRKIQIGYIIGAILWIIIFFWISRCCTDLISWIFLFVPLFVFAFSFWGVGHLKVHLESEMFQGNYLAFGLLIVSIIINVNSQISPHRKLIFIRILLFAFILIMFSLIDLWISPGHFTLLKHIRSMCQTAALTLLALALYLYYREYEKSLTCL